MTTSYICVFNRVHTDDYNSMIKSRTTLNCWIGTVTHSFYGMGATSGAGTAYPSGAAEFTPGL